MTDRINKNCDPAVCLVVDCGKAALYRNPRGSSQRGYCSRHKALAMMAPDFLDEQVDSFANWMHSTEGA